MSEHSKGRYEIESHQFQDIEYLEATEQADQPEIPRDSVDYVADTHDHTSTIEEARQRLEDVYDQQPTASFDEVVNDQPGNEQEHLSDNLVNRTVRAKSLPARLAMKVREKLKGNASFEVRNVDDADVRRLVEIDMERYENAYAENPTEASRVEEMMRERVANAREWMWVFEMDGEVEGFITGQPTDLGVEDFASWEASTDNGRLTDTYNPLGKNLYVVNLTAMRKASKIGGHFQLIGALGEKTIRRGMDRAIFSSRMPGLRDWAEENNINWHEMAQEQLDELAVRYSQLTTEIDGQEALYDRQLRMYAESGFDLKRVVRDGFEDPESLNYGVVCDVENPVPGRFRYKPVNFLISKAFRLAAKKPELLDKLL